MGSIEMTRFILIAQKVEKTAVTISDVVSQATTITNAELNNIIYAASTVMQPYTFGANGYVIISSVTQPGAYTVSNPPKVNWQYVSSGSNGSWTQTSQVGTVGNAATLPSGFTLFDKDNIIIAEVFYRFTPLLASDGIIGTVTLYKTGLYKPRLGALSTLSSLPFWQIYNGALL
jgi:Flp pilus assembly protein TadG